MSTKLLIADDHPIYRAAIAQALREILPAVIISEASSLSSLEAAIAAEPELDLVLLDLHMPGAQGFSSLIYLRGECPALPVLVISSDDHPQTVRRAQQFGAAGFIPKSVPVGTLQSAISTVLAGGHWFPAAKADRNPADAELAAKLAQLTPQQFRVLLAIADGRLNKQIAQDFGLAENTVKVHVSAILEKLGCYSRTQAAVLVKSLDASTGIETP